MRSNSVIFSKSSRRIFWIILLVFGISVPFFLVTYIQSYHRGDVYIFHFWANCLEKSSPTIYLDCRRSQPPDYPSVGLFLSAGAIYAIKSIFGSIYYDTSVLFFRYYLAFYDSLNFLLFIWLASLMQFRFPIFLGLVILLIPSTWIGGAVWGQIDNISLSLCLLSAIGFFKSWASNKAETLSKYSWKSGLWLLFAMLNFSGYILTKQLAIFSLPFFLLIGLITIDKFWKNFRYRSFIWIFLAGLFFILFFHYLDSRFAVPQFKNSSYLFSLHQIAAGAISENGFNIWVFLERKMDSSSHIPFSPWKFGSWILYLSPYQVGIFLYCLLMIFLIFTGLRTYWLVFKEKGIETRYSERGFLIALSCFFLGLSHLGFNVLLTGTNERYLYVGYPFLLIAVTWFCENRLVFSRRATLFCFLAASAYGFFVFKMIGRVPAILFLLRSDQFLSSIHLLLLLFLLDMWVKIGWSNKLLN